MIVLHKCCLVKVHFEKIQLKIWEARISKI